MPRKSSLTGFVHFDQTSSYSLIFTINSSMKIPHYVIFSVILGISLTSVYGQDANSIVVGTDKMHYVEGDTIYISGEVSELLFGSDVILMVIAPNGNLISMDQLQVDSNKAFHTEITTPNSLMKSSGTYTIHAIYDNDYQPAQATFTFDLMFKSSEQNYSFSEITLNFDFINPQKKIIQEHVDYEVTVTQNGLDIFGPKLSHSTNGKVSVPLILSDDKSYEVLIQVHKIMFKPVSSDVLSFNITTDSENIQSKSIHKKDLKIKFAINKDPSGESKKISPWIKNTAEWWAEGGIDDESFIQGMQYLIKKGIIDIPNTPIPASWMDKHIPSWVKNNASWWADDLIPEEEFIKGIKFLIEKGVIQV